MPATRPRRAAQQEGPPIAADLEPAPSRGTSQADVSAGRDGVFIALRAPEGRGGAIGRLSADRARAGPPVEPKAGCACAGEREAGGRALRGNAAPLAAVGAAGGMRAGMRAAVAAGCGAADVERARCAPGGGGWCARSGLGGVGGAIEQGLGPRHVTKRAHGASPEGGGRERPAPPALECRPGALARSAGRTIPRAEDARRRERVRERRGYAAGRAGPLRGGGSLGTMEAADAHARAERTRSSGRPRPKRGASNVALAPCRACASRPLAAPPEGALSTAAERAGEASSVARRGDEAAARLAAGGGREPPQPPKLLARNVPVPPCCRSWAPARPPRASAASA